MNTASAKQKGRRLQQWVRDRLLALGTGLLYNDVVSRSTGAGGTDLILSTEAFRQFPYAFECKNVERLNIWTAWAQAEANTEAGTTFLVIARNRQRPLAVVDADWLLTLLAKENV